MSLLDFGGAHGTPGGYLKIPESILVFFVSFPLMVKTSLFPLLSWMLSLVS